MFYDQLKRLQLSCYHLHYTQLSFRMQCVAYYYLLFLVITLLAAIAAAAASLAPEAASRPVAVAASAAAPNVGRPQRYGVHIKSIFEIFITEA
jgi:hypothetical protein